jgi:hypothetical protein
VADLLGTTVPSVLRWVCHYVDQFCTRPPLGEVVVIELDEMWHLLMSMNYGFFVLLCAPAGIE